MIHKNNSVLLVFWLLGHQKVGNPWFTPSSIQQGCSYSNLLSCDSYALPTRPGTRLKVVFTWVPLYQWGDAIDVKGDADPKRLGTPALGHVSSPSKDFLFLPYALSIGMRKATGKAAVRFNFWFI